VINATTLSVKVAELRNTVVDQTFKGIPLGRSMRLSGIVDQEWNVCRGDLALPVTTLTESAVSSNLATMAQYCARNGVRIAPHGKTTMAPQLFARQFEHGAWAMTAATPTQVSVMRQFGVPRIILANELVDANALRWVAHELSDDPSFEFYCLVDSAHTVQLMSEALKSSGTDVSIPVLIEIGLQEGRAGVRSLDEVLLVAEEVRQSSRLRLVGVEAYEGLVTSGVSEEDLNAVNAFFAGMREALVALAERDLFESDEIIITAGGSSYFDRVVAELSKWPEVSKDVSLILRSGCYVSHDGGKYEALSPLAGRRPVGETLRLVNGLTAWASVLSRPQPDLAILGIGKRDVSFDISLPAPRRIFRRDGSETDLKGHSEMFRLMDQHAFIRIDPELCLDPGDIVSMDLSHPCTAFDKFKLLPVISDDHTVVDAVLTFF